MKVPIVVVHGIGQLKEDRDWYFKAWKKHRWRGFEPVFYNASWSLWGFNIKEDYKDTGIGFKALSELPHDARGRFPLMTRLAYYGAAKLKALGAYAMELPWWKKTLAWAVDWLIFRVLTVETMDFVGDVFTYLKWEEYTLDDENPIRKVVRATIQQALDDFPDQPIHIVCHSLGTKIVWDILYDMRKTLKPGRIGILMTMGSPLQPLAIFGWTRKEDNVSYMKPTSVDHWLNVYDVRDPIGAPIGSAAFRRKGNYASYGDIMLTDVMPCANVCTQIGIFPWSAHNRCWKAPRPRRLFQKYITKYLDS